MRLSKTTGTRYSRSSGRYVPTPSWKTMSAAGLAASYCAETYTAQRRIVPVNTLLSLNVNVSIFPRGTPSLRFESGPCSYFTSGRGNFVRGCVVAGLLCAHANDAHAHRNTMVTYDAFMPCSAAQGFRPCV